MSDLDLFTWWAISISGGSIFLTLVSIYLYVNSKPEQDLSKQKTAGATRLMQDFTFVWVLLGLLIFYIISIKIGSAGIFAAGNILVEALLVIYLVKNRKPKDQQT
jgi:Flp pilus assembly protein TadB